MATASASAGDASTAAADSAAAAAAVDGRVASATMLSPATQMNGHRCGRMGRLHTGVLQ